MKVKYNNKHIVLPDCIIVGAAKSGTTALFKYLSIYDKVFSCNIKEPWFFAYMNENINYKHPLTCEDLSKNLITNIDDYSRLFEKALDEQVLLEASTAYLYNSQKVISNIKKVYGKRYEELKIIIILRNPIDRAWSHYNMHIRENMNDGLSFKDSINSEVIEERIRKGWGQGFDYIRLGEYAEDVNCFIESFTDIKIYLYDEFKHNPKKIFLDIKEFLSIKDNRMPNFNKKYNVSGRPKNILYKLVSTLVYQPNLIKNVIKFVFPRSFRYQFKMYLGQKLFNKEIINKLDKRYLSRYFKKDIAMLSIIINKNLTMWND